MLESAWLFIGSIATLVTAVAVLTTDDGVAIMGGVLGFVLWGVWTYGTLNLVVTSDAVTYSYSQPSLTIVGIGLALVPAYVALTGPTEIINRYRNPSAEEL